jgi:hypothetical protein
MSDSPHLFAQNFIPKSQHIVPQTSGVLQSKRTGVSWSPPLWKKNLHRFGWPFVVSSRASDSLGPSVKSVCG